MATTLRDLVEGVMSALTGQTLIQDRTTVLTQAIGTTDTTFTVDDGSFLFAGLMEIDTELLRIKSVDRSTNVVTLTSSGRGTRGTTAAAHANGAEVRFQPVMTYSSVIREIQAELNNLYPSLCQVSSYEFTTSFSQAPAYQIPADVGIILDVRFQDEWGYWQQVRRWEVVFNENTTAFPTGVSLRLTVPNPSTPIRVIYGKPFGSLVNLTDTLSGAGISGSLEDILRLGAMVRLLPSFDIARLSALSVAGADVSKGQGTVAVGVAVARELQSMWKARIENEVTKI